MGVSSFHRVRQLEVFETQTGFLSFGGLQLRENRQPGDGAVQPPKARVSPPTGLGRGSFPDSVFWHTFLSQVRALESMPVYLLLGTSFMLVNMALWLGVLRFCCLWQQMHPLLRHLQLLPLRAACKRFRSHFPALPKLDLASPAPTLVPLICSVNRARFAWLRARQLLEAQQRALPQMQNLIVTSVAGLLLMLLAVSSYPFQPHDLLLLFNWAAILSFVGSQCGSSFK
jgi:hypothetical protein